MQIVAFRPLYDSCLFRLKIRHSYLISIRRRSKKKKSVKLSDTVHKSRDSGFFFIKQVLSFHKKEAKDLLIILPQI